MMKDRIGHRVPRPTTNFLLRAAIQEEWDTITSDEIASMVDSTPHRIAAVMGVSGGTLAIRSFFFTLTIRRKPGLFPHTCY